MLIFVLLWFISSFSYFVNFALIAFIDKLFFFWFLHYICNVSRWTKLEIVLLILTFNFIVKYRFNDFEIHSLYHLFIIMLNNMSNLNIINNFNRIIMPFRAGAKSQYHRFIFVFTLIFNQNSLNPLIRYRRSTIFYTSGFIDHISFDFFSSFFIIIIVIFNIDYEQTR